jgi:hypothetical protein
MGDGDQLGDQLERELAKMRPRGLGAELAARIEGGIAGSGREGGDRKWSDRLLICAMGMGAVAACVIVGLLVMDNGAVDSESGPAQMVAQTGGQVPTMGSYSQALARANDNWIDTTK